MYKQYAVTIHCSWPRVFLIKKDYRYLLKNASVIPKHIKEDWNRLKYFRYLPKKEVIEPHHFFSPNLLLRVSEDCNLDCRYCFNKDNMLNSSGTKKMPNEIAIKSIKYFLSIFKDRELKVTFSGGEPLLNFETIRDTVRYFDGIKEKRLNFILQTNGTLMNEEILRFIIKNKVTLMFTLDFPSCEQDRNRPFRNGGPSFKKIEKNIKMIAKRGYRNINIKSNIASDSSYRLNDVTQFL